jgi:hypothetical protein
VPVRVLEVDAVAADGESGRATDRSERANRGVHAAGDRADRALEELV